MTKMMIAVACATIGMLANTATPAAAQSPNAGQWRVVTTVTSTGAHWNTFDVCILSNGTWYMIDQVKGSGRWQANGQKVHWRGNMSQWNDSAELRMSSATAMSGPFQQWEDGSAASGVVPGNLFADSVWTFTTATCKPPF